jgi:diguanylate cyclase (GGDEF)-like protein
MIDVDHFKPYNDQFGHQQGDDCLRHVARLLVDGAGRPGDLVARYGGEEFLCMLPDSGMAGALAVANRLIAVVRQADNHHPRSPAGARLTISIGAATAKELSGEPSALMAFADKLLYAAKAAGRNPRGCLGTRLVQRRYIRAGQREARCLHDFIELREAGGAGNRRSHAWPCD